MTIEPTGPWSLLGKVGARGAPRRIDYAAVVDAWNRGLTEREVAAQFKISAHTVSGIRLQAKTAGYIVRAGHPALPRPSRKDRPVVIEDSQCMTCRRRITAYDHRCARASTILPSAACCRWCGRRFDGGLPAPARFWVWWKHTLHTVDGAISNE